MNMQSHIFAFLLGAVLFAWIASAGAQNHAVRGPDLTASATLNAIIWTPPDRRNIDIWVPSRSEAECWEDARAFVAHGPPESQPDAVGVMAGCFVPKQQKS